MVVKGRAGEVTRLHDVLKGAVTALFPWPESVKPHFLRVEAQDVSERRLSVSGGAHRPLLAGEFTPCHRCLRPVHVATGLG